jgi:threonylcarbamoyladenosine tRNA methylthiotransferase CDKAL1
MTRVFIETYGCAANKSDSEIMVGLLTQNEFESATSIENSDVVILNTCIVKQASSHRMERRIIEIYNSGKPFIVAGCMAKAERSRVEKLAPKASIITPDAIDRIVEVVKETLKGRKVVADSEKKEKVLLPKVSFNKNISIVQIASGCLSACTFCETKIARGILKSYRPSSIIERIRNDLNEGFKEFWITSQDNGCYGFDLNVNLAELLKKIVELDGDFIVRVGMMNPFHLIKNRELLNGLIEVYKSEKIFKFLHIPLQSGSNKVLKDMRRGYTVEEFEEIVKAFRKEIKDVTIETDIIVGYPTETEEDFEKTVEVIKNIRPDVVNISKFSPRPKTPAASLPMLPPEIVNRRSKILFELTREIAMNNNKSFIGKKVKVFVDEVGKEKSYIARTLQYKPVVIKTEEKIFGKFVDVEIVDVKSNYLEGKLVI